ncbi:MAG: ATP-binding protein [Candidatus Dadabacteria bacterium]|nr:MAG: ATP-binding protein [Candidatus Dadabacteria bacterium]
MKRNRYISLLREALKASPVVALLGPRQSGKTTLAREFSKQQKRWKAVYHFDLESPRDSARLSDPLLALENLKGLIVIDEIQHNPEIFPVLRVLADQRKRDTRFLILGSASSELINRSSESLAGRIYFVELTPLLAEEVPSDSWQTLWQRGGFPPSFLAASDQESYRWRSDFVRTFLERDIPQFGIKIPASALGRFWQMLTHVHGNILDYSELGRSLSVSDTTVRRYLDVLTDTYMVRVLKPWHENISKRQVKSPKVYIRDSGILHQLLGIRDQTSLEGHPKVGASWEGFCLEQIIAKYKPGRDEYFFWSTHQGAELDLMIKIGDKKIGFEIKRTSAPKLTKGLKIAMHDLKLKKLYYIVPGQHSFDLTSNVHVSGLDKLLSSERIL